MDYNPASTDVRRDVYLSDADIYHYRRMKLLDVRPFDPKRVQPGSVDLTLGEYWSIPGVEHKFEIGDDGIMVKPGDFVLLHTEQVVTVSNQVIGFVKGKSSWARQGLLVECAGLVDPGFSGQLVLEVKNLLPTYPTILEKDTITLTPGMPIAQICFAHLRSKSLRSYGDPALGSKYQGQTGPVQSRA